MCFQANRLWAQHKKTEPNTTEGCDEEQRQFINDGRELSKDFDILTEKHGGLSISSRTAMGCYRWNDLGGGQFNKRDLAAQRLKHTYSSRLFPNPCRSGLYKFFEIGSVSSSSGLYQFMITWQRYCWKSMTTKKVFEVVGKV